MTSSASGSLSVAPRWHPAEDLGRPGRRRRRSRSARRPPRPRSPGWSCRPAGSRRCGRTRRCRCTSRSVVIRRPTASTVPVASPTSTTSPTPYWSSSIMNTPDRKSFTRFCAPNPMATPTMPADARIGAEVHAQLAQDHHEREPEHEERDDRLEAPSRWSWRAARAARTAAAERLRARARAAAAAGWGPCRRWRVVSRSMSRRAMDAHDERADEDQQDRDRLGDEPVRRRGEPSVAGRVVDRAAPALVLHTRGRWSQGERVQDGHGADHIRRLGSATVHADLCDRERRTRYATHVRNWGDLWSAMPAKPVEVVACPTDIRLRSAPPAVGRRRGRQARPQVPHSRTTAASGSRDQTGPPRPGAGVGCCC